MSTVVWDSQSMRVQIFWRGDLGALIFQADGSRFWVKNWGFLKHLLFLDLDGWPGRVYGLLAQTNCEEAFLRL